jgi:hypothetical protein
MNDTSIIACPKCGAEIPLSEAVSHRIREQLASDFEKQRQSLNAALAAREEKLASAQAELDHRRQTLQDEVDHLVTGERAKVLKQAVQQADARLTAELNDAQTQLQQQREQLQRALEAELALRKEKQALIDAKASLEIEVARTLDVERGKIVEKVRQQVVEQERFKLAEKEQLISGLQQQITALKQRAEQGSVQLQGEALEVELEHVLRQAFVHDEILEIKKGLRGADVLQQVRTNASLECGAILWEAKHARKWAGDWTEKLKQDQREAKAELAVLVTTCPPPGLRGIGQFDGVWVCEPVFAAALAAALRQGLIATAVQRLQDTDSADKMVRLYDYLCGVEFRQHIEGIVEAFKGLQEQLGAEQRAFARQWKEREQQIGKALQHTAMLYGAVQGIAGRQALAEIKTLELTAPECPVEPAVAESA